MEFTQKYKENFRENFGVSIELMREVDNVHYSFYLQNRDKMKIERDNDGKIVYFVDKKLQKKISKTLSKNCRGFIFTEKDLDDYLNRIGFRGAEIKHIPIVRYMSEKEFDKFVNKK